MLNSFTETNALLSFLKMSSHCKAMTSHQSWTNVIIIMAEQNQHRDLRSDHHPVMTEIELSVEKYDTGGAQKWCFISADWGTLRLFSGQEVQNS